MEIPIPFECPFCGEPGEAYPDQIEEEQRWIDDCAVCCRPIQFVARSNGIEWILFDASPA
jgi:hypothetical protein